MQVYNERTGETREATGYQLNALYRQGWRTREDVAPVDNQQATTTGSTTDTTPPEVGNNRSTAQLRSNVIRTLEMYINASGMSIDTNEVGQLADLIIQKGNFGTPVGDEIQSVIRDNEPMIAAYASGFVTKKTNEETQRKITALTHPDVTDTHKSTAADTIKSVYGRDPTGDETAFFANELAKGESPYELRQFLMTTPEYQTKQAGIERERVKTEASQARTELGASLAAQNQEAFKRATPEIIGAYMRSGRLTSSGLDAALAKSQEQLQRESQNFLANAAYEDAIRGQGYRREDFVGTQKSAYDQYLRQNDPRIAQQNSLLQAYQQRGFEAPMQGIQYGQGYASDRISRGRQVSDYERQQSDFFRALGEQRKSGRESAFYGLLGSAVGAGIQGATYGYANKGK